MTKIDFHETRSIIYSYPQEVHLTVDLPLMENEPFSSSQFTEVNSDAIA